MQTHGRFLKIHLLSLSLLGFGDLYALLLYIRTNERDFTVSSHNVLIRQPDTCSHKHKHVSACVCVSLSGCAAFGQYW